MTDGHDVPSLMRSPYGKALQLAMERQRGEHFTEHLVFFDEEEPEKMVHAMGHLFGALLHATQMAMEADDDQDDDAVSFPMRALIAGFMFGRAFQEIEVDRLADAHLLMVTGLPGDGKPPQGH